MDERTIALRKAAILVAALDTATADRLLAQMPDEQSDLIRRMIVALGEIDQHEQQQVIDQFFQGLPTERLDHGVELEPGLAQRLSVGTSAGRYGGPRNERAAEEDEESGSPFGFLHETADERLGKLLLGERAQTIALVISHLPSDRASRVLAPLTPAMQVEVLQRLVELDEADPMTLREVERSLQSRVRELIQQQRRRSAGLAAVARILECADGSTRKSLVGNLLKHDRRMSQQLQLTRPHLQFDDLLSLDRSSLAAVLGATPTEVLVLALAAAEPDAVEKCLSLLPADRTRLVQKSLKNLGPTRLADMEQAQQELVRIARQLEEQGQLDLHQLAPGVSSGVELVLS